METASEQRKADDCLGASGNKTNNPHTLTTIATRNRIRIGQWDERTLRKTSRQAQLENQIQKFKIAILGISEMRWCNSDKITSSEGDIILYSGKENRAESRVGFLIAKNIAKPLKSWTPVSVCIITARFHTTIKKCVTIQQCYTPTEDF
ncbi:uncharacterized protein LOC142225094 [Haematobia irritans]|uniref:uncharacterized protein LOC142225094 n=1 Tax=Haematobia irritans TaxID=7368 RepID=UPI003F506BDD